MLRRATRSAQHGGPDLRSLKIKAASARNVTTPLSSSGIFCDRFDVAKRAPAPRNFFARRTSTLLGPPPIGEELPCSSLLPPARCVPAKCAQPLARRQCTRRSSGQKHTTTSAHADTSKCPPQRPRAANQQHRRQPKRLSPQHYAFVLHAAVAAVHLHTWNSSCELRMNDTSCECTLRVCLQDDLRLLHSIRANTCGAKVRCKCLRDSRMLVMNSLRQLTPKLTPKLKPHTSQKNAFTHRVRVSCVLCVSVTTTVTTQASLTTHAHAPALSLPA